MKKANAPLWFEHGESGALFLKPATGWHLSL
jgi:hypothetical protein